MVRNKQNNYLKRKFSAIKTQTWKHQMKLKTGFKKQKFLILLHNVKFSKDLKFNCDVIFKDTLGNNIRNICHRKF